MLVAQLERRGLIVAEYVEDGAKSTPHHIPHSYALEKAHSSTSSMRMALSC